MQTAVVRMPDREACAAQLAAALADADVASQADLLEILAELGGKAALEAVARAAQSDHPELQDKATRLLGRWMTIDAAEVLAPMMRPQNAGPYRTRALRGYLRIVRQFDVPPEQRVEMCAAAWQAAEREAEKRLVLEILKATPASRDFDWRSTRPATRRLAPKPRGSPARLLLPARIRTRLPSC